MRSPRGVIHKTKEGLIYDQTHRTYPTNGHVFIYSIGDKFHLADKQPDIFASVTFCLGTWYYAPLHDNDVPNMEEVVYCKFTEEGKMEIIS